MPDTQQETRTENFDLDSLLLGRDSGCHVVLPLSAVSRTHARITRESGVCYIEDCGSSFGTQVNNEPLPQGEKRRLYNGDIIAIAQFDLSFATTVQMNTGTHAWRVDLSRPSQRLSIRLTENPYLRIMNGPNEGTRIELEEGHEYIVGRTAEAQILLNTDLVSRKHAKLRRDLGGTHVEDLGSRNGIRLNRKAIAAATLSDGDELEIGGIKMLYIDLDDMKNEPLPALPPPKLPPTPPPPPQAQPPPPPPPPPPMEEKREPEPPQEEPAQEASTEENLPLEEEAEKPPPSFLQRNPVLAPLVSFLQRNQTLLLLGIGGGTALITLIFLILVLVGA